MANVHTPERMEGESFSAYKARRADSNKAGRAMRTIGNGGTSSRKQQRDDMRRSGTMGKRIRAADALVAAWAQKRTSKEMSMGPKDEHGPYTLTGSAHPITGKRRMWLAGISAQRGY